MSDEKFYGQSKSVEHYTLRFWWQLIIEVMNGIDLDPSSDPGKHIPAKNHFTKEENGLIQKWIGKIYLNPPFGRQVIRWFQKFILEMDEGRCTEGIILWKAALETEATDILVSSRHYRCSAVPKNRIGFEIGSNEDQKKNGDSSTFTPIFHYFGPNEDRFRKVFGKYCRIWKAEPQPQTGLVWFCKGR